MPTLITSLGDSIIVSPNDTPDINMNNVGAGQVRYNGNLKCYEVFDGFCWVSMNTASTIMLTPDVEEALNWAKKAMIKDNELQQQLAENPTLKDAYDKFKTIEALVSK